MKPILEVKVTELEPFKQFLEGIGLVKVTVDEGTLAKEAGYNFIINQFHELENTVNERVESRRAEDGGDGSN